jgi:hypothetical protein
MPADGQYIARFRERIIAIQRSRQTMHHWNGDVIRIGFGFADPFFQVFEFSSHQRLSKGGVEVNYMPPCRYGAWLGGPPAGTTHPSAWGVDTTFTADQ